MFSKIKDQFSSITKHQILAGLFLMLTGALIVFYARFVFVEKKEVHYHANFALYINGVREKFDSFTFYEEVASCSDDRGKPQNRVHMHDMISHVIHVHDAGATWGNLFENIGYSLSRASVLTDDGLFVDGVDGKSLSFILNGQKISNATNRVIGSEDVLLIDYSDDDQATIQSRYDSITKDAAEYNRRPDPSACKGGADEPFVDRLKRTIGISE